MGVHTFLYRRTGGRLGHTVPGVRGKMLLLDHVGAKSGTKRTSPLLYVKDGEDVVVVASKGGFPKHPAWFHNLDGQPRHHGADRLRAARRSTPASPTRRSASASGRWRSTAYHGYEDYAARSKGREIPLVVLEPAPSPSAGAPRRPECPRRRRSPPAARGRPSCRGRRRS